MGFMFGIVAQPFWLSLLLLIVIPSILVACGPWVVRRFIPVESIADNNEVAGFKFATLGVVYAVLLGLAVISVWQKYSEAEFAATEEAAALAVDGPPVQWAHRGRRTDPPRFDRPLRPRGHR